MNRIGLDSRFLFQEHLHPHAALQLELLRHNFASPHPYRYVLFHASQKPNELVGQCLAAPNVDVIDVGKGRLGERLDYFTRMEIAAAKAKLSLFFSPFYRCPILLRLLGVPVFNSIHDVSILTVKPELLPERFHSPWKRLQVRAGFKLFSMLANCTIIPTQHAADEITRTLNTPPSKAKVIYHCYSNSRHSESTEFGKQWRPYLLFIGENMPKKNLQGLIDAMPKIGMELPSLTLVARTKLTSEQNRTLTNGGPAQIVEVGRLSDPDLRSLIFNAETLVLPSFHEGFGLPVLEALAAGTPVCVSENTAMAEVAGKACTTFDPSNSDDIASACVKTVTDSPRHDAAWVLHRSTQLKNFEPDTVIPKLIDLMAQHIKATRQ